MPQTIFDEATVELMDYQQFLDYAADSLNYSGQTEMLTHVTAQLRQNPFNTTSSLTTREQWAEQIMSELRSNGYQIEYNGNNQWTGTVFPSTAQVSTSNPVNSNLTNVARGSVRNYYGGLNEFGTADMQFWVPQRMPVSGGLGSKAMYFLGSIGSGVAAASTGIWLGKAFDSALYNAMPDFWDSIGWNTLNPETWGSLIEGTGSPFAGLMNFILGVDGTNGNAQAYMDENALAYMAYCMYNSGIFSQPDNTLSKDSATLTTDYWKNNITFPVYSGKANRFDLQFYSGMFFEWKTIWIDRDVTFFVLLDNSGLGMAIHAISDSPFNTSSAQTMNTQGYIEPTYVAPATTITQYITNDDKTVYYAQWSYGMGQAQGVTPTYSTTFPVTTTNLTFSTIQTRSNYSKLCWDVLYHSVEGVTIEGISNQPNATLPDTTGWDDLSNVLPSLQQQYPDFFQNPMIWNADSPYDDDTGHYARYIPVPMPNATSATDTQPTSGTQTQTNTSLNTTPQDIVDWITKAIQQTDTNPATPPTNPTDTGTGDTPTPVAPTGSASALWSVYHPTQAQINSFGAWLWGSPFLTNIGKLFQNPIDGVISLHKIYATPIDSGTGNIVVGTLDSNVSSATVNQQYVEVDCGSISLNEDFGNVFDYDPYTKVSLYLPFIGIVALNVSDVMRSTIHVVYGVDVFTGACIAMVEVSRDGCDANLYQYTGNCAVHYPLSNVQQSQLLSGLITIGAGVGAIIATGGTAAPAAATGIASGIGSALHSNIGRSGGFSANAGAMGIKIPYLIIERPQTKVADTFPLLDGYPTNYSVKLGNCSNHVVCKTVHVSGISATKSEIEQIEALLKSGVEV